ncbi:MAG: diguanylate cyclase [Lachnospiraceae bacterium]
MKNRRKLIDILLALLLLAIAIAVGLDFFVQIGQGDMTNQVMLSFITKWIVLVVILLVWFAIHNQYHNQVVRMAHQRYQSLLDNINGGMVVATCGDSPEDIIVTYVSAGFTDMTGYKLEDIQHIFRGHYLDVLYEDDREEAFRKHQEQITDGNIYRIPYRIKKKDNDIIWVMDNGYMIQDEDGLYNHSILTDITIIKKQEEELRLSENRFSVAINASSGAMFEVNLRNQTFTHFENAERIFGVSSKKLIKDTSPFSQLPYNEFIDAVTEYFFHLDDYKVVRDAMKESETYNKASYEARLRRGDNSYIWARVDLSFSKDTDGLPIRLVGLISDIDDIKRQTKMLENKVQTDSMTGLYNKVAMDTLVNKILKDDTNSFHALIVLDIDNFKGINDTLGHAFGDVVLIEGSTKLKALFRSNDIVGRMGGDEFAILMKDVSDTSMVLKKVMDLSGVFRQTYVGEKEDYKISCSMGIVMIQNSTECFEKIYRKADAALYQAKQNGKDQFVLYQEQDSSTYPIASKQTQKEDLHHLKTSHNIEDHIFELLYDSKDFNISIHMALAAIGQQYHVSRVAIFENNQDNNTTNNTYEWCNDGVNSERNNLQNIKLESETESVLDCFDQEGLLYCNDIRELKPYMRKILEDQGICSTLQMTIINGEKIYGFIAFDECKEYRIWTSEEIEKLSFLSKVLSVFLFQEKSKTALLANLKTRLKILDVLPDCICVVNPETHCLEYVNKKMQQLFPAAQTGTFCFATLRGGAHAPCNTCIVEQIKRDDTDNLEIISSDQKLHLKVNALSIQWTNNQNMVLLYGISQEHKI